MTKYDNVLGGGFREASDDYLPSGYVEDECPHGVYRIAKVGQRWQIVCDKCESTHISPDELDEITDWMSSLCRGA